MLMIIKLHRCLVLWLVALSLLGVFLRAEAHNGKTAYAIPISDITIDGKLDDWPQEMATYPIEWVSSFYKSTPPDGLFSFRCPSTWPAM